MALVLLFIKKKEKKKKRWVLHWARLGSVEFIYLFLFKKKLVFPLGKDR